MRNPTWPLAATLATATLACSSEDPRPPALQPESRGIPEHRLPPRTDAFTRGACDFTVPGHAVECGTLTVPEHHGREGRTLSLAVAIVYARTNDVKEPVVYLEGGPGGGAIDNVFGRGFAFPHLVEDRDLVVLDQRGTGRSRPSLACPEWDENPDLVTSTSRCRQRLLSEGVDLDAYHTEANADDVEALRAALGFERWSLYGISYGTRLALEVLRRHPERVERAIIDGVLPPQADFVSGQPRTAEGAFRELSAACESDPRCARTEPLSAVLDRLMARLAERPAQVKVRGAPLLLTASTAANVLFAALYSAELVPYLPFVIRDADAGDFSFFVGVLASQGGSRLALGMYLSVVCKDELPFTGRERYQEALRDVGAAARAAFEDESMFDACAAWNVAPSPARQNEGVRFVTPTLAVSGAFDPVTPRDYALLAMSGNGGVEVLLRDQAHGASVSRCGADCVQSFLRSGEAHPCATRSVSIDWRELAAPLRARPAFKDEEPPAELIERVARRFRERVPLRR